MKIPDREDGQGLVEYALMLALVAVVVIAILIILGPTVTVVYARVIGGFSGQSVTLSGGEVIVLGLETDMTGSGVCELTVSGSALVGLQDGEIMANQLVKARAYVGGNATSLVLSATANGNGLADLGGASATDPNAPCGKVTFQLVP